MNCIQIREKIALFLGGDLPAREATMLTNHLNTCDLCQTYRDEMRETVDTVHQLKNEEAPEYSLARLQAVVLDAPERDPRKAWKPVLLGAVALLLLSMNDIWTSAPKSEVFPEFRLTQTVQPKAQLSEIDAKTEEMAALATHVIPTPLMKVKLYTEDPNVVIYWFGD